MSIRSRTDVRRDHRAASLTVLLLFATTVAADVVTLTPVADNTLFGTDGATSGGAGPALFCGRTGGGGGGTLQRAVLRFGVADVVPAGATITAASLTLELESSGDVEADSIALHRLLASWGEGDSVAGGGQGAPSTPGDATWLHTFFPDQFWTEPGGDFAQVAGAVAPAGFEPGPVTWTTTPALVADVQSWLDEPTSDHGWLLLGNEADLSTARRFFSREASAPELRPALTIEYEPAASCSADFDGDGVVGIHDLLSLLFAFGPCDGCPEDLSGNGSVNIVDLILLFFEWGPCP